MITNMYVYTGMPDTAAVRNEMSLIQLKTHRRPSPAVAPPYLLKVAILINLGFIRPRFISHSTQSSLAFLTLYK